MLFWIEFEEMAIQADGEGKDFTEDLEDFRVDEGDCTTFENTGVDEEDWTSLLHLSSKQEGCLLLLLNITSSSKSCSTVSSKSFALDFSDKGL